MKTLKMKKITLGFVIIALTFTACKKSKVEEPVAPAAPTIVGLWKGSVNTNVPLALLLRLDNSILVYNTLDTANVLASGRGTGTWNKMNNIVQVTYKFNQLNPTITAALTVNTELTNMSGDAFSQGALFGRVQLNK